MLAPLTFDDDGTSRTITCRHARIWPPKWSRLGTSAQLRPHFTPQEYERAKTWENVCGLQAMDATKCLKCPHARKEDGTPVVPSLAMPAGVSQRRLPKVRL
jgi:hypothetical protein